ncbi:LLM class flavin-dependent oxidoreductase [Rhodococcus qingshengii]|uniref:LLM class flavin-dependent oxidoreductase n=1 Tax=Rhodococcus qingshengii TaxID=334542 RepID=UPI001E3FC8BB|nr:LLM class flavin-dependent oxidoreductase [Rhodococcus qingshengii]MCQ4152406.1 LLM class flavin-dependent oxidoreductase [Rhodococcus qingshengii]UGQ55411.1 LLM class flavin-dependent oxidoreductase [Rhodococcus qingshengii]
MKAGIFQSPYMLAPSSPRKTFDWAVEQAIFADEIGLHEYWVAEHSTVTLEEIPSPELVIAAAARHTKSIVLAPGAHLLPYHNPATLAIQTAWLSNILQGRYMLGIGPGAFPNDGLVHGHLDLTENPAMQEEAIEVIEKVWKAEPFHFEGKYFKAGFPDDDPKGSVRDTRPWGGRIEIAMTTLSPNSRSVKLAGARGYSPISFYAGDELLKNHWETYDAASREAGRQAERSKIRSCRELFVASTDSEARELALGGTLAQVWAERILPIYKSAGLMEWIVKGLDVDPDDVDLDYLVDNVWLVGSVETVTEKIQTFVDNVGGIGTLLITDYDYTADPTAWRRSLELFAKEVVPNIKDPY